ncbi:hypothetical protein DYB38_001990 [Aphanomyces astaci]|uniref:protein-tyrosine-phosphatase n=3 Tax=Aphanomyces astaci TaxID=112090 RepID=A0A397AQA0_APHAT|nr:hypothetical protein DYB36_003545 [Aphanomyces astaci]RHY44194.1 hypothetical protein DYB34_002684 [Aphanomyces astaci]RHY56288.1 hypothetical protein DYB38_001990 [Aphanomyces astaci]
MHSAGGRSRSPAIVVAYLMSTLGTSFDEALIKVRTARPVASLNSGFEDQLRCFEKAKRDVYIAHQLLLQTKIVRARLRRSQQLDVDLYPPPKASSSAKKADMRMLLGTLPRGFYLSRPTSPKAQTFVPPLRSMGSQFGCAACGKLLYCAANVLRHSGTTDAALWTVAIDRKRAISCPETPRGRQGASLPLGRPFTDTGFDDDDDDETAHHDMLQASVVPSTCHDDDTLDMALGTAIQDVVIGSTQADEKAIRPATTGDDASGRRRPVDGGSSGHITSSSPPPLPHNAGLSGSPPSSAMMSKNLSIQQSKKHWRSWTSLRPSSFGFRKANAVTSRSDVMSDELHTWRHQMKALEKHGSRHQIFDLTFIPWCVYDSRRVSAAVAEDEKQFVAVMGSGCDVIFIEPLAWFGSSLHPENGDLMCPNAECRATRVSTTPVAGHGIHIHTTLLKKGDGTPVSLRRLKDDLDNARPHTSSSSMRPTLAPSLSSRAGPETSSISAAAAILEPLEWRPKTSATSSSGDLRRLSTHAHASLVSRQPSQQLLSQPPSDLHHHQPVFQIKTSSSVHRCFGCGGSPEMCLTCFSECKKSDMTKYKQSLAKGVEWLFAKATTRAFHHMSITMSRMIFGQVMNTPIKRVETLEVETDQLHGTVTELTKHSHVRSQLDEEKVAKLHATIEVERQRVAEKNKELAAVKMQLTAALATIERQLEDYSLFEGQQNLADILSGDVVNSLDFAEHPLLYDPTAKFAKENKLTDKTTKAPSPKKSKTDSPGTMSVATIDRADRILMQWDGKSYAVLTLTLHDAMCKMKSRKKDFSMNPLQRENGMALTDQAAERYVVRFALHDLSFLQGSIVQIAKWRELKDAADATNKDQTVSKKIKLALAHLFELKKKLDGDTRKAHDGHVLWWKSARIVLRKCFLTLSLLAHGKSGFMCSADKSAENEGFLVVPREKLKSVLFANEDSKW